MKITMYQSTDCPIAKIWLAHMDFGNDTYMSFFGPTAEAAEKRANDWYDKERARQLRIVGSSEQEEIAKPKNNGSGDGRGQHFLGKVWMINRTTGHKARVEPSEVSGFEASGYVRGGPRSK